MTTSYHRKDAVQLAFERNKKRLRVEATLILDELLNEALAEMSQQFTEALNRGEVLEIGGTREEMTGFLRTAAQKQLGA